MSKIGKAFMSLILDKKAREALEKAASAPKPADRPVAAPPQPRQPLPEPSQAQIKAQLDAKIDGIQNRVANQHAQSGSPTRQQLIQNALRVHAAKQDVLDDLSAEQKLKLQVMAMKAMAPKRPTN
ncbi:hypothetical protein [Magnetovibrio sp.]|uniref:hypothetical protein n=1 Tax=Magnetovibrio sp. TaxID=2024836 RepID=UPI002F923073